MSLKGTRYERCLTKGKGYEGHTKNMDQVEDYPKGKESLFYIVIFDAVKALLKAGFRNERSLHDLESRVAKLEEYGEEW